MNCLYTMPPLTVTCSISRQARSPLQSAVSTTRRDSPVIGIRSMSRFHRLAQQMAKATGSTGISGASTRKCECHLPARHGTSPGSTASRWTLPVSYTHLGAHETPEHLVCRLLLEK